MQYLLEKILNSKFFERFRRTLSVKSGIYFKLKRLSASSCDEVRTVKLLEHYHIDCVIDVGANTGQFAEALIDFGYKGKIISFEPVSVPYQELSKRSKKHKQWIVAEKCAIGNENKVIEMNVTDDTVFSSVLKIRDDYARNKPKSRIVSTEKIAMYALDAIIGKYIDTSNENILLKIDTQGFEKQVLGGAAELIKGVKGIKLEIPLLPIYDNTQWMFDHIIDFMREQKFYPRSFHPEGVDLKTGIMTTIDGTFIRNQSDLEIRRIDLE